MADQGSAPNKSYSDIGAYNYSRQHNGDAYHYNITDHDRCARDGSNDALEKRRAQELSKAAFEGQISRVRRLLRLDESLIDHPDEHRLTVLHHAALGGHEDVVVEILDAGAGINAVSKSGTALCLAALKSRASVVKLLLERRAKAGISTRLGTAFHCAAYAGSLQCLELLLATNADPNVETQVDIQLLESIFYDNSDSTPPSRGLKNIETIKECSPSTLAMWKGINSIEIINLLGAQVQSTNTLCKVKFIGKDYQCEHTSLMIAANCGHTLLLEHLLQTLKTSCPQHVFHEFVNRMDQHGPTALILAAVNGDTTMVRLLCESGADAGLADATGTSPLWWAAEFKYQDCARILLNFGALVDARNRYGITPLIIAIRGESQEMVQLLLEAGADASDTSFDLIKNEGVRQKAKLQFALTYASRFAEHTESA